MKAVMLTPSFAPEIGGVQRHVEQVCRRLAAIGHEITIITQFPDNPPEGFEPEQTLDNGLVVKRLNFQPSGFLSLGHAPATLATQLGLLAEADIIHCHDVATFVRWYGLFRVAMPFKRVFITFHGYEGYPLKKRTVLLRRLANRLCAGSINVGGYIEKWYGTKGNHVILGGIDAPQEIKPPPVATRGVFVGRLEPYNAIGPYLEALAGIAAMGVECPPVEFIGPGEMRSEWTSMIHDRSLPVSNVPSMTDPGPAMDRAGFCLAGGYLSVLEAMVRSRPVFALAVNPIRRDYYQSLPNVEDMITLAPSPDDLAKTLTEYLADPIPFNEKAERSRQWASTRTWDAVAEIYLKLWSGE